MVIRGKQDPNNVEQSILPSKQNPIQTNFNGVTILIKEF